VKLGAGVVLGEGVDEVFEVPDPVEGAAEKKIACQHNMLLIL